MAFLPKYTFTFLLSNEMRRGLEVRWWWGFGDKVVMMKEERDGGMGRQ